MIKNIAILTSGGDAPGMNNAIKAVVNASINSGIKPYIVYEGYKGLTEGNIKEVTKKDVKEIGTKGGTIIYSSRFPEFKEVETRKKAIKQLEKHGINAVVGIGGDGSYMGLSKLTEMGIRTIGLPGTIDNDIASTDYTIGFGTAWDTIVKALDQIRDTSESHNRATIVEVMGRYCGDLAINSAIATNAEVLSIPERKLTEEEIIEQVRKARENGNRSIIVVVTEYMYDVNLLAKRIEKETSIETRATVLGHTQRGGNPSYLDRYNATIMAGFALKELKAGKTGVAINIKDFKLVSTDILEVVKMERPSREDILELYDMTK